MQGNRPAAHLLPVTSDQPERIALRGCRLSRVQCFLCVPQHSCRRVFHRAQLRTDEFPDDLLGFLDRLIRFRGGVESAGDRLRRVAQEPAVARLNGAEHVGFDKLARDELALERLVLEALLADLLDLLQRVEPLLERRLGAKPLGQRGENRCQLSQVLAAALAEVGK